MLGQIIGFLQFVYYRKMLYYRSYLSEISTNLTRIFQNQRTLWFRLSIVCRL